jgi:hypothetical protein
MLYTPILGIFTPVYAMVPEESTVNQTGAFMILHEMLPVDPDTPETVDNCPLFPAVVAANLTTLLPRGYIWLATVLKFRVNVIAIDVS